MLEFFEKERGIRPATLEAFGVDVDGSVAVYTYPHAMKFRRHEGDVRKFWQDPAGKPAGLFGIRSLHGEKTMFICEGESDTMRLWQELMDDGATDFNVVGIPGVNGWTDDMLLHFTAAENVYVILDNETDYKIEKRVEDCWQQIRRALGRKAKRVRLPQGAKDVCEFFDAHGLESLWLIMRDEQHLWHFEALDLSVEPGPVDWLMEGVIARGDIALLIGEPGIGKSWISLGLAVAMAEGHDKFLGKPLHTQSPRVLYVDEENPELLVRHRLRKLGLTDKGQANLRFLHRQGIRLDKRPELLLDEVLDWEPSLLVLDSLTRMHTKDENHSGEISRLFNDGINPLSRETGATVLLLHHVTKTESSSSFMRARGSGDISASPDTGLDLRGTDERGGFKLAMYKSRWVEEGQSIRGRRHDEGDLVLLTAEERKNYF